MTEPIAPDPGLCSRCRHVRCQKSAKGSSFLRCGLADESDAFPRYPPLPVLRCAGFVAGEPLDAAADAAASDIG